MSIAGRFYLFCSCFQSQKASKTTSTNANTQKSKTKRPIRSRFPPKYIGYRPPIISNHLPLGKSYSNNTLVFLSCQIRNFPENGCQNKLLEVFIEKFDGTLHRNIKICR